MKENFPVIANGGELKALSDRLILESVIGVDTEFDWRTTYFPKLCLIQIATKAEAFLIDPLSIEDLSPLKRLLENKNITKVFHSPTYDLKILNYHTKAMINSIFDTQLACEFLGFSQQPSLSNVLEWLIGKTLDKSTKLSDWTKRPLSDKQATYALEDVKYLVNVFHTLKDKLIQARRLDWFTSEINDRFNEAFYLPANTDTAYLKLKRYKSFRSLEFEYLKALASLREKEAIKLNKPIRHILKDHSIYQIIAHPPKDIEGLSDRFYQLSTKQVLDFGPMILKSIDQISHTNLEKETLVNEKTNKKGLNEDFFKLIFDYFKNFCEEHTIISQLVATRSEIKQFMINPTNTHHPLNQGWRYEFIGKHLAEKINTD